MASKANAANERQMHKRNPEKSRIKRIKTEKNKERKLAKHLKKHPNDATALAALK